MNAKTKVLVAAIVLMAATAGATYAAVWSAKLPKCSGKFCKDTGCSAEVLCASGASVKTCAEVCGGH